MAIPSFCTAIEGEWDLLQLHYLVRFETGRPGDHQYCGTITTPNGTVIVMVHSRGIWRLPTLTASKAAAMHNANFIEQLTPQNSCVPESNPFRTLLQQAKYAKTLRDLDTPTDLEKLEIVDAKIMQLIHDWWSHPSNTKMERIVRYYKCLGFPKGFLQALKKFKCK
eukprot:403417-Rhodomonas_salina.1